MSESENDDWLSSNTPPGDGSAETEDDGPRTCSACEAPLDPDQLYCLECGTPSDIAPKLVPTRKAGPLIAAGLIGLGLVGGGVVFAVLDDGDTAADDAGAALTAVETTQPNPATEVPATTEGGLPPDPRAPTTDAQTTDDGIFEDPSETETVPGSAEEVISDWPVGRDGWTVFVSSVRDAAQAAATRERVQALGEPAGLLFSSDHEGLNPGFWVVYSGIYDTRLEAVDQAANLAVDLPGANPRRVVS